MEGNITIQIISLVLNFILASGLVGTILFFKPKKRKENAEAQSSELKNTEQIVTLQSQQIQRLDGRVETLEKKVDKLSIIIEHKDVEISENRHVIRQAFKCEYVDEPSDCPVLTLKAEYDRKKKLQLEKEAEEARLRAEEAQNEDGK
jgi:TolA-binding protein